MGNFSLAQPTLIMAHNFMNQDSSSSSPWQWQKFENSAYLTCSLLADWQHGFFTNHFPRQLPQELVKYLNSQASVFWVKQIHSNIVLATAEIKSPLAHQDETTDDQADGIITTRPLESVWCASADCTPVLIADRKTGNVAAIHSGWRGTAAGIVSKAIARLQTQGANPQSLLFALGPAIDGKVYQVGIDVAVKVLKTVVNKTSNPQEILEQGYQLPGKPILPDPELDKVRLDVTQIINLQIQQQGISPEQIAIAPYCTYQNSEYFFSYRRTKEKKIQWSGIVAREAVP
jgi:YfiH family protein